MTEKSWQEIVAETSVKEKETYELFLQRFDRDYPAPKNISTTMMEAIGWQFILIVIQNVAAVILAALRTAEMFYTASAGMFPALRVVEAFMAIIAIEGGAVVFATIRAEIENRSKDENVLRVSTLTSVRQLWFGIGFAVIVSIIAGLGQTFDGFGLNVSWFKWALALTMAVGASLIAAISGDILGTMLARFANIREQMRLEYEDKLAARAENKRKLWESAPERQIARSELNELKGLTRHRREGGPRPSPTRRPTSTRSREIRLQIYSTLDQNWEAHHDPEQLIGPTEIQRVLGVAKSYASTVRHEWADERGIVLQSPAPESSE
jgi:hypothetical protein